MKLKVWGRGCHVLWLVLLLFCLSLAPPALAAPLEVTGLDLRESHFGGTHHLYLSLPDSDTEISPSTLLLKAGDQWQTPESVVKRSAHFPLDLVLLILPELLNTPETASALESQFKQTRALIGENHQIRLTKDGIAFSTDWDELGNNASGNSNSASSVQAIHSILEQWSDAARRVILWESGGVEQDLEGEQWRSLQNLLIRKQTTLFIFSAAQPTSAGNSALAVTGGRFIPNSGAGSAAKETALKILEEYKVTFSSQGLGWIAKTFEILTIDESATSRTIWQVPKRQIWEKAIENWLVYGVGSLLLGGVLLLLTVRMKVSRSNSGGKPYFELISPQVQVRKLAIPEKNTAMSFLESVAAAKKLRLPSNVSRVWLKHEGGNLLLEDSNFKNALLVNRRRTKHRVLQHNDILDMGEVVLRFVSPRTATVAPPQTSLHSADFKFFEPEKPRGPLRKNPLTLTISGGKGSFPLTKNLFFIGESEINDLMIKGEDTHPKHAKIQKIGNLYQLVNLANSDSTQVNGRRIAQKFLRDGDALQLGNVRMQVRIGTLPRAKSPQPAKKTHHLQT
ncbi:MAG: hypothetical protein CL911_04005 [Deltaproteobacteria bacterium]|nr:hypothetical protein [Deltaproteobacteria bacterium]